MARLTAAQQRELQNLVATGFTECKSSFGDSQSNRPLWTLVDLGFAEFDWGPNGSWLKTQGFSPTEAGRAALAKEAQP